MSGPLAIVGKRNVELLTKWLPSLVTFGTSAAILGVYISEWRVISDYIPFYNGKFADVEEAPK